MTDAFSKRHLSEMEQLLHAEAALRRDGTELLDDSEYRALRDRFIEGGLTLEQLADRVDNLAMTRSDSQPPRVDGGDSGWDSDEDGSDRSHRADRNGEAGGGEADRNGEADGGGEADGDGGGAGD